MLARLPVPWSAVVSGRALSVNSCATGGHQFYNVSYGFGTSDHFHTRYKTYAWKSWE